jgi:hypothetical protein
VAVGVQSILKAAAGAVGIAGSSHKRASPFNAVRLLPRSGWPRPATRVGHSGDERAIAIRAELYTSKLAEYGIRPRRSH